MKSYHSSGSFRPFEALKGLLKSKATEPVAAFDDPPEGAGRQPSRTAAFRDTESEEELFRTAMADVIPIDKRNCVENSTDSVPPATWPQDPDVEAMLQLKRLVDCGEGFIVAQTPEYMEGTGYGVHPEIAKRLHRGDYSIQAHIDLHGYSAAAAHEAFDRFLNESISAGRRAILIVHGRGLSSPSKPVLKSSVYEWLTRGPWRKWILAFTSARLVDGGAGATYVLLRKHPLTRSKRKKKHKKCHKGIAPND